VGAIGASVVVSLVVGWIAGMCTRKRSERWCPADGSELACLECATAGLHRFGSPANSARRVSTVDAGGVA